MKKYITTGFREKEGPLKVLICELKPDLGKETVT